MDIVVLFYFFLFRFDFLFLDDCLVSKLVLILCFYLVKTRIWDGSLWGFLGFIGFGGFMWVLGYRDLNRVL